MSAVIEVQHLRKSYGDLVAVDDVSFTVEEGEVFGILGPSGSGKSTIVECIKGLRNRDGGEINVLGLDPRRDRAGVTQELDAQLRAGCAPERMHLAEALSLYSSFYRDPADWRRLMASLGLAPDAEPNDASGGEMELSAALSAIGNPQVAIFDELTTELDPQSRQDTWELIESVRATGLTILLVTRFPEEAVRLCDRIALIERGRIKVDGTPAGLAERMRAEQRIRFRPSAPFDETRLGYLAEVSGVVRRGEEIVVTGTSEALGRIVSLLADEGIVAEQLRVTQATLEDAFAAPDNGRPVSP
ncbi:ABC transporter ATP-binding protein [Streptomyces sp. NPDC059398]|uniref:ABC transporter ATP-binding protein n=1 Tax=Streptomyces sp. NPDC059398 TaxID=3346820 RepID=UPI0036CFCBDA